MDLSDRPLLSFAIVPETEDIVVGSADHAAYVCRIQKNGGSRLTQTLYTKTKGHTEWVTSIAIVNDTIVTGGMDGALWCWLYRSKNTKNPSTSISRDFSLFFSFSLVSPSAVQMLVACSGGLDESENPRESR